jgi:predicted  nucleic acid-binding Zn-ribbon protein
VHPDLKTAIELQQVDQRVAELTSQIEALPSQIQNLQAQLHDFIHAHEERKHRLGANQKERRDLDAEIQSIQTKISRHKDQLYQVKTNEQFKAMKHEIGVEEENIRKIEDQILEKMMEAEQLEKLVKDAASRLDGEKARVAAAIQQLESERQADIEEQDELQTRREELSHALSDAVRELYERVRGARRGVAVAAVRDGCCTACNVRLRPQAYNDVRMSESMVTCESCSRILYYVERPPDDGHSTEPPGLADGVVV